MPSAQHDAIVLVLDVGKSVANLKNWEEKTFFEQSRACLSWIIQRKLISQSLDVVNLVLIGSDNVSSSLSSSGYNNICCKFDFQPASWEMLKFIECDVETTENFSDWLGALIVSIEMLKVYEEFNNVKSKKIVFFSDFTYPATDNLDAITSSLRSLNIDVTIIGPDNISNLPNDGDNEIQPPPKRKKSMSKDIDKRYYIERQRGEALVYEFWRKLPEKIIICTFQAALKQLCSYSKKVSRKTPWNCILDIGDLKISISMLKKTDPKSAKKFDTKYAKTESNTLETPCSIPYSGSSQFVPVVRDKVLHYKVDSSEGGTSIDVEVTPEDTIEGYRYGTTVIPFSVEDKTVMEYKPGPKSFSVIGFTKISSVPFYLLSGDCSYIVVPREKDENAEIALSAIIQGMKKLEYVAIVRKVYSNNRGLSLGILKPFIEEIVVDDDEEVFYKECLIFVELAYQEEVKSISFPSLEKFEKEISQEQNDVIDDLIEGMNLMKASAGLLEEECEAFDVASLHDYKEQFYHYCVIQRGLYPDKPLPTSLPSYIENFIKIPKSVEEKNNSVVKKLKKLFNVTKVLTSEKTEESHDVDNSFSGMESGNENHFTELSISMESNTFKRDLMIMFTKNFPDGKDMEKVFCNVDEKHKTNIVQSFQAVVSSVRTKYLNCNPDMYNWWILQFKAFTFETENVLAELWNVIVSEKLGFISNEENNISRVPKTEAENFYFEALTQSEPAFTPKEIEELDFTIPTDD